MSSTSETGHAKNVGNLKALNDINAGFGTSYNPNNPLYILATMVSNHTVWDGLQGDVNTQKGIFEPFQNARVDEFKPVKKLVRKVRTAAKTCGASAQFYKDVNAIVNKILGERVSKATPTATDPAGTSASQQSFDNTTDNMDKLVKMLQAEPLYAPNEVPLKVVTLTAKQAAMNTANNNVKSSVVPYNNALIKRNKAFYTTTTGLVDVGQGSKDYVRQVFGYSSPEFRLVSGLKFKKLEDVD